MTHGSGLHPSIQILHMIIVPHYRSSGLGASWRPIVILYRAWIILHIIFVAKLVNHPSAAEVRPSRFLSFYHSIPRHAYLDHWFYRASALFQLEQLNVVVAQSYSTYRQNWRFAGLVSTTTGKRAFQDERCLYKESASVKTRSSPQLLSKGK